MRPSAAQWGEVTMSRPTKLSRTGPRGSDSSEAGSQLGGVRRGGARAWALVPGGLRVFCCPVHTLTPGTAVGSTRARWRAAQGLGSPEVAGLPWGEAHIHGRLARKPDVDPQPRASRQLTRHASPSTWASLRRCTPFGSDLVNGVLVSNIVSIFGLEHLSSWFGRNVLVVSSVLSSLEPLPLCQAPRLQLEAGHHPLFL